MPRPHAPLFALLALCALLAGAAASQGAGDANDRPVPPMDERDFDDVKYIFSEASLYMLGLTYAISILHMIFDYLAFKNDVGFFKNREDYTGISGRSILSNFVCSVIILLYLLDNEFTSWLIVGSMMVSTAIEGWKVNRVLRPRLVWKYLLPWMDSSALGSKGEQETDDIDARGFTYLMWVLYPLVGGWGLYTLVYHTHKSWWSWLINSLANGVYTFGFVMMTPQLFINYKLKSVAHMPWKVFMYKAFNTFIDDVFSFIVVMPTAHRIACLRDDLVFFVYLYQRYLYPVDKKRPNEFGIAYEDEIGDDDVAAQAGGQGALAVTAASATDGAAGAEAQGLKATDPIAKKNN